MLKRNLHTPVLAVIVSALGWALPLGAEENPPTWGPVFTAAPVRRTVLRRYGEPEEVAHATLSLVLPAAGFITGATLVAALWGVFIWKEFKEAPSGTGKLLSVMFASYLVGLVLIIAARLV